MGSKVKQNKTKTKLIDTENRLAVARGSQWEGDIGKKSVDVLNRNKNIKSWFINIQSSILQRLSPGTGICLPSTLQ